MTEETAITFKQLRKWLEEVPFENWEEDSSQLNILYNLPAEFGRVAFDFSGKGPYFTLYDTSGIPIKHFSVDDNHQLPAYASNLVQNIMDAQQDNVKDKRQRDIRKLEEFLGARE